MKIIIDPGHGGKDVGAVGSRSLEKDINLKESIMLKNMLEKEGYEVKLTRSTDKYLGINKRGIEECDIFISMHKNSVKSKLAKGTEVYYSVKRKEDKNHSSNLSKIISDIIETVDRGSKLKIGKNGDDYFGVIRNAEKNNCEHIFLIETEFISNREGEDKLLDEKIVEKYLRGIVKYINKSIVKGDKENKGKQIDIEVDGEKLKVEHLIVNNKVYVGIRELLEKMGYSVKYEETTRKIKIKKV